MKLKSSKKAAIILVPIILAIVFVFLGSGFDFKYIIPGRLIKLLLMVVGGVCIALSSILFQTITHNKIITPAIMGYESIYILMQSSLLYLFGVNGVVNFGEISVFLFSTFAMLVYSSLFYFFFLRKKDLNIYFMLLMGFVVTLVISAFDQLLQYSMNPGEFSLLTNYSHTSFNRGNEIWILFPVSILIVIVLYLWRSHKTSDVLLLGRDQSQSLGVDYREVIKRNILCISLLVSISTSLIGPVGFMGVFVANAAYLISNSNKHKYTFFSGCSIAVSIFLVVQILIEHVFNYKTTVGILVNLICGGYFFVLLIRQRNFT